LEIAVT